jgi:rubrerythrin
MRVKMAIRFSAVEVFELAEKIERDGARFYYEAAEKFNDSDIHKLLMRLAAWEEKHRTVFAAMRRGLCETDETDEWMNSDEDLFVYWEAIKDLDVFGNKADPARVLIGDESAADVLVKAIEREKDSISYYNIIKTFVSSYGDREKVDDIIKEELMHVWILSRSLEGLG